MAALRQRQARLEIARDEISRLFPEVPVRQQPILYSNFVQGSTFGTSGSRRREDSRRGDIDARHAATIVIANSRAEFDAANLLRKLAVKNQSGYIPSHTVVAQLLDAEPDRSEIFTYPTLNYRPLHVKIVFVAVWNVRQPELLAAQVVITVLCKERHGDRTISSRLYPPRTVSAEPGIPFEKLCVVIPNACVLTIGNPSLLVRRVKHLSSQIPIFDFFSRREGRYRCTVRHLQCSDRATRKDRLGGTQGSDATLRASNVGASC